MSSLPASFHTIYRQVRVRERSVPGDTEPMSQGERFSVACLAFVLHHDETFRTHFLRHICDWKKPDTAKEFQVIVEPTSCGDLAVTFQ